MLNLGPFQYFFVNFIKGVYNTYIVSFAVELCEYTVLKIL